MRNWKLESTRLRLKPLSCEELNCILQDEFEKVILKYDTDSILTDTKSAIEKKLKKMGSAGSEEYEWYTYWLIIEKTENKGIGFIGFKGPPKESGQTEVGYSISANYRRRGLMSEALTLLIDWAFESSSCSGVFAMVRKDNVASAKVLRNCSFSAVEASDGYDRYVRSLR